MPNAEIDERASFADGWPHHPIREHQLSLGLPRAEGTVELVLRSGSLLFFPALVLSIGTAALVGATVGFLAGAPLESPEAALACGVPATMGALWWMVWKDPRLWARRPRSTRLEVDRAWLTVGERRWSLSDVRKARLQAGSLWLELAEGTGLRVPATRHHDAELRELAGWIETAGARAEPAGSAADVPEELERP